MHNCKNVYPHLLVRPLSKYKVIDHQKHLANFVNDVRDNGKIIDAFIADNLKRAMIRLALIHSSYFPCEYCNAKGVSINLKCPLNCDNLKIQAILIDEKLANLEEEEEEERKKLSDLRKSIEKDMKNIMKKKKITWPSSNC